MNQEINSGSEGEAHNVVGKRRMITKGFCYFLLEAFKDPTKIIILGCAIASLVFSVVDEGVKEGVHEIGAIVVTLLATVISAAAKFTQDRNKMVADGKQTPFQARMDFLASLIGVVSSLIAVLGVLENVIWFTTGKSIDRKKALTGDAIDLQFVIGCVISNTEGLSLGINCAFAKCTKKMNRSGELSIKNPFVYESIGSISVICSDKTGVLTSYAMEVDIARTGLEDIHDDMASRSLVQDLKLLELFKDGIALSTSGKVYKSSTAESGAYKYAGSPTEKSLLSWGVSTLGMEMHDIKTRYTVLHTEAFDSENKRSGVLACKKADNTLHVLVKGAPKRLLSMCSGYYGENGVVKQITYYDQKQLEKAIKGVATRGLRCIAFAHSEVIADMEHHEAKYENALNGKGLIFMGFVGLDNPCRRGLNKAVSSFRNGGVAFKMVTGDDRFMAITVARDCGIITDLDGNVVVDGEEFTRYTHEEKMNRVDHIEVLANATPSIKLEFIEYLEKRGHRVATIGKDASSLKRSYIGVTRRSWVKDIDPLAANEISDVVTSDANAVMDILEAVIQGRRLHNNIRRLIQFLITANVAALATKFISSASGINGVPITAAEMAWINLIMITLGVLNLAIESPMESLMLSQAPSRSPPIITNTMWRNVFAQSLCQVITLLIIIFKGRSIFNDNEGVNNAIAFNTFVLFQLFNLLHSRNMESIYVLEGLYKHPLFLVSVVVAIILQIATMHMVMVILFPEAERLNQKQWGICVALAAISLPFDWVAKCIKVPTDPHLMNYLLHKLIRVDSIDKPDINDLEEGIVV